MRCTTVRIHLVLDSEGTTPHHGLMNVDVRKQRSHLYSAKRAVWTEVDVPALPYLAVDGHGDPNTASAYEDAISALYTTGYSIRSALKARTGITFTVGPLEGLWTSSDPTAFVERRKDEWRWTMLIPLPDDVTHTDVADGADIAAKKHPGRRVDLVDHRVLHEGRCLQTLHVGPYDDEGPALAQLHDEVMPSLGVTFTGPHHEVYLSDPRRSAPEKLRTILRQPIG